MKIAIIGCGSMGEAILKGLLGENIKNCDILIVQRSIERSSYLRETYGLAVVDDISLTQEADVILLGVKPQDLQTVLAQLKDSLHPKTLIISLAVGVTTKFILEQLGTQNPVVRAMPNTPALVRRGMTGLAAAVTCNKDCLNTAKELMATVGTCVVVDEELIDLVAAVSGSGPAYFFWLVENLTSAAVDLGLSKEVAELLVRETFVGAGMLLDQSNESAAQLRAKVTSPKGTTQAAINVIEAKRASQVVKEALAAAIARAHELRKG